MMATDILSILGFLSFMIAITSGITGFSYGIYRWWVTYKKEETHEAMQDWAINRNARKLGLKPIVFDSRESHVLTIFEKGEQIYLQSIQTPNKQLKKAMKLGLKLINEEAAIERMTIKHRRQKRKLLEAKQKELEKILKKEKKSISQKYKKISRIDRKLEKLESKK